MSGIEVAGLVLGAFPILVSALEHYRESAEILSTWWSFKRKYQKVKHDLEYLRFSFSQNLRELLLQLHCDEDEIEVLMVHPENERWRDPSLEQQLKERLLGAYVHYFRAITSIQEVLEKWKHELGLDEGFDVEKASSASAFRIKFSFSQSKRDELLKDFKEYNGRLREILQTNDRQQLATAMTRRTYPRSTLRLVKLIRKRATILYHLLTKAWNCQCRSLHHANLRLQEKITETSGERFDVVFLYSADNASHHSLPWKAKDTSLVFVEQDNLVKTLPVLGPSVSGHKPMQKLTGSMKRATIASPSIMINTVKIETLPPAANSGVVSEIKDLCSTLSTSKPALDCYGRLREGEQCYQVLSGPTVDGKGLDTLLSLRNLLEQRTNARLNRRQRYELAHAIASAYVQLYSTPWLSDTLEKSSIVLPKDAKSVAHDQPFLARTFDQPGFSEAASKSPDSSQSLTNLGILLLELCFGTTIEASSSMEAIIRDLCLPPGFHNQRIDYLVALEWSKLVVDETGPQYAMAVEWCLKVGQTSVEEDESLQFRVFENVVLPLQECCKLLQ